MLWDVNGMSASLILFHLALIILYLCKLKTREQQNSFFHEKDCL